jgi:hypothetical protein
MRHEPVLHRAITIQEEEARMEEDLRSAETRQLEAVLAPLGEEEQQQAIQAAKARIDRETDRYRILGAEVMVEKPTDPDLAPERLIEVLAADYANRRGLRVLVRPTGAEEIEVLVYEPVFHPDEIAEARQIAERDERLAELARREEHFVTPFSPASVVGARVIGLRYLLAEGDGAARLVASVAVNLPAGEVIRLDLHEPEQDEGGG